MIIGELYLVKKYFWLMFPTKELAGAGDGLRGEPSGGVSSGTRAYQYAKWFGEQYNCNVYVIEKNTYVVLLEQEDEKFFKLLDCNGNVGWIYCYDFFRYFELVKE